MFEEIFKIIGIGVAIMGSLMFIFNMIPMKFYDVLGRLKNYKEVLPLSENRSELTVSNRNKLIKIINDCLNGKIKMSDSLLENVYRAQYLNLKGSLNKEHCTKLYTLILRDFKRRNKKVDKSFDNNYLLTKN